MMADPEQKKPKSGARVKVACRVGGKTYEACETLPEDIDTAVLAELKSFEAI